MKQSDIHRLKAFLVALVQLPATLPDDLHQEINALGNYRDPELLIKQIKLLVKRAEINQFYDKAYQEFRSHYHAQPKDKIMRPAKGSLETAQENAEDEETNVSLPATVVVESIDKLSDIFQGDVIENSRKSYEQFQANPPENITTPDYCNWAEHLCKL
ncbi:hypothetical protein [Oscillatoria salina]|uniref:hypothetical protein n=1 Tax=Oscillatoria salina TaxID=331517 RepID=UPI0013B8860A|nr:hypothetical protein [Oscillatoria salina]MBZ8182104.1 hypothetical protein [Oscillatoria salina IIICB1]NET87367.1 hypothetical protein [Kamptonema sp. SIO1D9]